MPLSPTVLLVAFVIHEASCMVTAAGSGMRTRALGFSDILVSELALGTQRWGSADFNAPDEATCHRMLSLATDAGVNLVDTAEQYPIPSGPGKPEGSTEKIIGSWLAQDRSRREKLVIASKITGAYPSPLKGSLKRPSSFSGILFSFHRR